MTGKLVFAVLLIVVASGYAAVARHAYRETLALASRLRNPGVKAQWNDQGQPQCLALLRAARIGAWCLGLSGLIIGWMAV